MRKYKKYPFLILAAVILACLALFFAIKFAEALIDGRQTPQPQPSGQEDYRPETESREWKRTITYNGKKYRVKDGLTTLLLLGIDAEGAEKSKTVPGTRGRSDAIMLLLLNDKTKTIQPLSISRDTITTVEAYGVNGEYLYTGTAHINMQWGYGDSPKRSNYLSKKCVSNLLHGMYIDGVMSMKMDAIPTVVDAMGGLKLTLNEDYSYIDQSYTKGAAVTLNGTQAESFVRYRDTDVAGSNEKRVERQSWLVEEMFKQLRGLGGSTFVDEVIDKAGQYIENDISAENLKKLSSYKVSEQMLKLPGQPVAGKYHDEFHYDEQALQQMIVDLFYEEVAQ